MKRIITTRAADAAFGATVNALLFQRGITNRQLGEALGLTGQATGKKLRGQATWTLLEVLRTAAYLGMRGSELLPTPLAKNADNFAPALLDPALIKYPHRDSNPGPTD